MANKGKILKRFCPRGHDTQIVGRKKTGGCIACIPGSNAEYRAEHLEELRAYDRKRERKNLGGRSPFCKKGHDIAVYGRDKWGKCRECARNKANVRWHKIGYLHTVKKNFGLSPEQYQAMFDAQDGCCAICRKPQVENLDAKGKPKRFAVDHDHATGEVRALLCYYCNLAIGAMDESVVRMFQAISYLKKYQRIEEVG